MVPVMVSNSHQQQIAASWNITCPFTLIAPMMSNLLLLGCSTFKVSSWFCSRTLVSWRFQRQGLNPKLKPLNHGDSLRRPLAKTNCLSYHFVFLSWSSHLLGLAVGLWHAYYADLCCVLIRPILRPQQLFCQWLLAECPCRFTSFGPNTAQFLGSKPYTFSYRNQLTTVRPWVLQNWFLNLKQVEIQNFWPLL